MTNLILGLLAIIGVVFVLWCIYTTQELDEDFNPLKPQKTLKDLWHDIINEWDNLNHYVALSLLVLFFFTLVYLINIIIFKII